jgi:hypothetical protein
MRSAEEVRTRLDDAVFSENPEQAAEVVYEDAALLAEGEGQVALAMPLRARLRAVRGW